MKIQQNHKPIYLLLLVFIVPMILSWGLFHYHQYFEFKTVNHGTLINPPVNVQALYSDGENGKENKWRIMHVDNGMCDEQCKQINYELHQVQKALGKDQDRVSPILISGNDVLLKKITLTIFRGSPDQIKNKIYLVDPRGFLFMVYADTINPMDILKDMKKVLEVSQIG